MKKPKIKIIPIDETDKVKAKIMEKYLNQQYPIYEPVVNEIVRTRQFVEMCYGIETPDKIWDRIAKRVVEMIRMSEFDEKPI